MKIRRRDKRVWCVVLGVFIMVFLFTFLVKKFQDNSDVEAASLANFDPGYIISDYQMGNYNSMSEADIQRFLSSKVSCDKDQSFYNYLTSHYSGYSWHFANGHIVCLPEERFGNGETIGSGETAAHIIWQAAQDYRINPQVLIVLLQKEQGLITDKYPNTRQYRSATGYGCPDTAACSSKYYGFKNQVRNAAALFRSVLDGGWTNYPLGNNYVKYNPNSACGGSVVNIRSLATSALYRYTPYQPNASALAAGYGSGDSCGAYGNRNFYLYFEDWFGGIVDTKVNWEKMKAPRVMKINKSTLLINTRNRNTTNKWLYANENYYFTKKTEVFWDGEKQTCLQRKIDEGTDECVLISRLSDFSLENDSSNFLSMKEYEITQWTCIVNIYSQEAECGSRAYSKGDVLIMKGAVTIDGKEFLIENNRNDGYAVLKARTRRKVNYEEIGIKLMKLIKTTYKYNAGEDEKVQTLTVSVNPYIKIANKVNIDGKEYYRTAVDKDRDNNYVIPVEAFNTDVFDKFVSPRNMMTITNTKSVDLGSGKVCNVYNYGNIKRYINKITLDGVLYFQSEKEAGTQCAVKATDLSESPYNFSISRESFVPFKNPRNMKMKRNGYAINISDGTTCEEYYNIENVQRYVSKIEIGKKLFYRTENNTNNNSKCAIPAEYLAEL